MPLTRKQVCYLRGLAHGLGPAANLGKGGYTPAFAKEVDRNLADHELVKIRLATDERDEFARLAAQVAAETRAELIQTVGRICVLYREAEEPKVKLPTAKAR